MAEAGVSTLTTRENGARAMTHFKGFESFDEMQQWMARQTELANDNLHPVQRELTWGSYWVNFALLSDRIVVFGRVDPLPEADDVETLAENQRIEAELERGYMFGRAYSMMSPEGELGDTHRFSVWPIEARLFEMAKAAQWDIDRLEPPGRALLEIAFAGWRAQQATLAATETGMD